MYHIYAFKYVLYVIITLSFGQFFVLYYAVSDTVVRKRNLSIDYKVDINVNRSTSSYRSLQPKQKTLDALETKKNYCLYRHLHLTGTFVSNICRRHYGDSEPLKANYWHNLPFILCYGAVNVPCSVLRFEFVVNICAAVSLLPCLRYIILYLTYFFIYFLFHCLLLNYFYFIFSTFSSIKYNIN